MTVNPIIIFIGLSALSCAVYGTDAVMPSPSAPKHTSSDAAINTKLKAKLITDQGNSLNVRVDTSNGVVTLKGEAKTEQERMRAEELASGIEGVRQVNNKLALPPNRLGD